MNRHSIRSRLTAWYVALVAFVLTAFCGAVYAGLDRYLTASMSDRLSAQALQIGQTWLAQINESGEEYVTGEIDEHLAPGIASRLIRLIRPDCSLLYQSRPPQDQSFEPAGVALPADPARQGYREENVSGKEMLLYSLPFPVSKSGTFLIEVGAPYSQ